MKVASAKTPTQKTEAVFYAAMDRRASGDAKGADVGLKEVLVSGGVDLVEVSIARELLTGARSQVGGQLPLPGWLKRAIGELGQEQEGRALVLHPRDRARGLPISFKN